MTKRPSDSDTLPIPESKHARQEIWTISSHLIPPHKLLRINEDLRGIETDDESLKLDVNLRKIFTTIRGHVQMSIEDESLDKLGLVLVEKDVFRANAQRQGERFVSLVRAAAAENVNYDDVLALVNDPIFWNPSTRTSFSLEPAVLRASLASQAKAVEGSWTADYVGQNPLSGLRLHVGRQLTLGMSPSTALYARHCSIVQSSGMGKSRLLDEFSKEYFLIPVNLRGPNDRGYPPADHTVRQFLTGGGRKISDILAMSLIHHFLLALFEETAKTVTKMGSTKSDRIRNFRYFMSEGQSMDSTGKNRNKFYDEVITRAQQRTNDANDKLDNSHIVNALDNLREVLNVGDPNWSNHLVAADKGDHKRDNQYVDVFIAFDEAHTLADSFDLKGQSRFVVLRRKLSLLSSNPLFSFFLSTTGKITQFDRPRGQEASDRLNDGTHATPSPYIYLGFDQLMQSQKVLDRWTTLKDVTSMECIAQMGRPLWGTRYEHGDEEVRQSLLDFAIQKLLCGRLTKGPLSNAQMYAVLSQRLALDINTPQYLFNSESPLDAMRTMHEQIANHMRVCVAVGAGIESLRGVASSEPILSEAASRVMLSDQFCLRRALSLVLTGFSINQGDRGELLVAAFFAWARDKAIHEKLPCFCSYFSLHELFSSLFSDSTFKSILGSLPSLCHIETKRPFGEVFKNANMHFNHMIKPQVHMLVARRFLLYYMARGAAALGANCQPGFDAVYPFLYDTLDLDVKKLGFIIIQIKNDPNLSESEVLSSFSKMDPFICSLLDNSDKDEDGRFPIPIIRIVFSLSVTGHPRFTHVKYKIPSEGAKTFGKDGRPAFTSYDYLCSGIDPNILRVVEESPDSWAALANKRDPWRTFYRVTAPDVLRSQLPGCGDHEAHFSSWLAVPVNF